LAPAAAAHWFAAVMLLAQSDVHPETSAGHALQRKRLCHVHKHACRLETRWAL